MTEGVIMTQDDCITFILLPLGLENNTSVWGARSSMLDCHVLKGFGIYMIGILDRLY